MKIVFTVFLCLLFGFRAFGQADQSEVKQEIKAEIGVAEIALARDDGSGKPGAASDSFAASDVPIHCLVRLDSPKAVNVKMNVVAVKAFGLKPESIVVTVNYKTNGTQNGINFDASPATIWAAGAYRIDVFLDGKPAKSLDFEVRKSPKEIVKEKQLPPKPKPPAKSKQKPRKI